MKNKMMICFAALTVLALPVFAGSPSGHCRPHCPPPHCHRHHHHCGSSGVRLAADIVSLVGASLNVLRGPVAVPVAAVPVPAVPVAAAPVAVQPAVSSYYYPPAISDYRRYNNGYVPMPPVYR